MKYPRIFFFKESGLGDDLMVFWAATGAVLNKIISPGISLFFEKPETRAFLTQLAPLFPEIKLVQNIQNIECITFIRHTAQLFKERPLAHFQSAWLRSNRFCEPYYHKWLSEYGRCYKPGLWVNLAIVTRALKVWTPPYDETYDGWQQLGVALNFSEKKAKQMQRYFSESWNLIKERIVGAPRNNGETLLFPSGGSAQNFSPQLIGQIKYIVGDVKVVRFTLDREDADLRFANIQELVEIISQASLVITSDSLPSHIAQFYARKHLLICTRSRPANVCYPYAGNTVIIDLGASLKCRPCPYTFRDPCAAGHSYCLAQNNFSQEHQRRLANLLGEIFFL